MSLQRRFVPCLIVFLLCFPCYFSLQASPPYDYLGEASGYDSQANHLHFSTIQTREIENWPWRNFGSKTGKSLASVKMVNVNYYGAKGDGSDATEVYIHTSRDLNMYCFD